MPLEFILQKGQNFILEAQENILNIKKQVY